MPLLHNLVSLDPEIKRAALELGYNPIHVMGSNAFYNKKAIYDAYLKVSKERKDKRELEKFLKNKEENAKFAKKWSLQRMRRLAKIN